MDVNLDVRVIIGTGGLNCEEKHDTLDQKIVDKLLTLWTKVSLQSQAKLHAVTHCNT
jgi:hypothetical protein